MTKKTSSPLGRGTGKLPVKDLPTEKAEELLEQGDTAPDVVEEPEDEDDDGEGLSSDANGDPDDEDLDEDDGDEDVPKPSKAKPDATEPPKWAVLPTGLKLPRRGTKVAFIRIPASWTPDPTRGDRWCACWPLTENEERMAYMRARGDSVRSTSELAKQTIRVVDGVRAFWGADGRPGDVRTFWAQIGPKGRQVIRNHYVRTHTLQEAEILDFFSRHYVPMTVT